VDGDADSQGFIFREKNTLYGRTLVMTTKTSLFVFSVLIATAWLGLSLAVDAAPLNPMPCSNGTCNGGAIVDCNGTCQNCVDPAGNCGGILYDNFLCHLYHDICRDFKRNNCWPRPFVLADRQATRAPFAVMVNKGWQRENTLGGYHFDPDTGELNDPGRRRVHWIVTQEIPSRRSVFVHRAMKPEVTLARIDSVQQWVAQIVPQGELPPVLETNVPAPGRSAEEVDRIRVDWLKSMPAPVLPANTGIDTGYSE
jgi:hypothetical protein